MTILELIGFLNKAIVIESTLSHMQWLYVSQFQTFFSSIFRKKNHRIKKHVAMTIDLNNQG